VEQDRTGGAVRQQVVELVGDVPVVDVDGRAPGLGGAEHALEVLVAVVQVQRHVVLQRDPAVLVGPLLAEAQAGIAQDGGQPSGAIGDLGPRQPTVPPHEALPVGDGGRNGLVQGGEVQLFGDVEDGHRVRNVRHRYARLAPCRPSSSPGPPRAWPS
jgi:hypothetical protein